jgi:hypothetical protein
VKRCGTWVVDLTRAENPNAPASWLAAVRGYMRRHPRTPSGPMAPPGSKCYAAPTPKPGATQNPNATPGPNATPTPKPGKPGKPTPPPIRKPHKTPKPKNDVPAAADTQANVTSGDGVAISMADLPEPGTPDLPEPGTPDLPLQRQPVDLPGSLAAQPVRLGRGRRPQPWPLPA